MLSHDAITEFQEMYKAELGVEITYEEASERAEKFLHLFRTVYQPMPKDWLKNRTK
ncbi:hypothetical protein KBC89_00320 [Candidatus Woesebacteria bacterium]|nr:hypothetical protein [Candidatus Woesebacteria bacterium]